MDGWSTWVLLPVLVACDAVIAGAVAAVLRSRDRTAPRHRAGTRTAEPQEVERSAARAVVQPVVAPVVASLVPAVARGAAMSSAADAALPNPSRSERAGTMGSLGCRDGDRHHG